MISDSKIITERIDKPGNIFKCLFCDYYIFAKRIIFRNSSLDGVILFNYIGKGGINCFYQYKQRVFCKNCFNTHKDIIARI